MNRQANLIRVRLQNLSLAVKALHNKKLDDPHSDIGCYHNSWDQLVSDTVDIDLGEEMVTFGLDLAKLAESNSFNSIAQEVMGDLVHLVQSGRFHNLADNVMMSAGEMHRRMGDLESAKSCYQVVTNNNQHITYRPPNEPSLLGRLYYEIAYVEVMRGDSTAAYAYLQRSQAECELVSDDVGVAIARALQADILNEEGQHEKAAVMLQELECVLGKCAVELKAAGSKRAGLARRWIWNCRIHLAQALIAKGDCVRAIAIIDEEIIHDERNASFIGLATLHHIRAQCLLGLGEFDKAFIEIEKADKYYNKVPQLKNHESRAATYAILGALRLKMKSIDSGMETFRHTCELNPDDHNRPGIACAWIGVALVAIERSNLPEFYSALDQAFKMVTNCSYPIRVHVLELMKRSEFNFESELSALYSLMSKTS